MSRLVDGKWIKGSIITSDESGAYDRIPRSFLDGVSKDHQKFQPEKDRYHLYVSYACPWAHRTLIYRKLKGLEDFISFDVVSPDLLENGWTFDTDFEGATGDRVNDLNYLYQIYQKADPEISTSSTVPILWDKKNKTIVNNESSEIIRIFNGAFNHLTNNVKDYYPSELRDQIDVWNEEIYDNVNNGVYKAGFAKTQKAYDEAVSKLFTTLDKIEKHLADHKFLVADKLTEADIRLVPTLLRFDIVYFTHFKCNVRMIKDYPNLSRYLKSLYNIEAIKNTTNFDHIKRHYYYSHDALNPFRIVPKGPILDFKA